MPKAPKISLKHSVEGVKELYLIIVGLGLTQTLWDLAPSLQNFAEKPTDSLIQVVALAGYISIIFQFTLGTFNVLTSIAEHSSSQTNTWSKSIAWTSFCFLISAICIILMGKQIKEFHYFEYCFFLGALFVFDTLGIVGSHRPWEKQIRFQDLNTYWDWFFCKCLYVAFCGIFGNYAHYFKFYKLQKFKLANPTINPEKVKPLERIIKETHYWWCSANVWTIIYMAFILPLLLYGAGHLKTTEQSVWQPYAFFGLSLFLLAISGFNFRDNARYFFGKNSPDPNSKPFRGVFTGFCLFVPRIIFSTLKR